MDISSKACPRQLSCLNKLIRSKLRPWRWGQHMHQPQILLSPWGGEVAISQENDLITSVNGSVVCKLVASLSTMRGISLDHIPFPGSFQVYFVAQE